MISLSAKVEYGLLSLAYMVEHPHICSARAISEAQQLPLPLLMNILKSLHGSGLLTSERGSRGGYQICVNLNDVSLHDFTQMLDEDPQVAREKLSSQPPLRALQYKVLDFLKQVRQSDHVVPGRRNYVPVEWIKTVRADSCTCQPQVISP